MRTASKGFRRGGPASGVGVALLLVAVGAAVYAPSVNAPFLFDDHGSIVGNPHVRRLWPPAVAMSAPPQAPTAGRPIACASFALNYFFCGLNTRGYHAVNVALHLACALLLFGVVRRALPLLARAKDARPSGLESDERWNTRIAFAVALVWMLHPLQTDAVTYVTQRTELLVGFFYLATLYCFIRGCVSPRPAVWFAATFTSCALGMGSKEVMVSAPLTVILFDRAFVAGSFLNAWQQRRKLHTALAGTWMVLLILIAPGPRNASIGFDHGISAADYLRTQAGVLLLYLRLSFWPRPLVISYDDWPIAHTFYEVGAQCLAIAALLGATVWMLRHKPRAGFLGAWFFLILAPTSSFVPIATEAVAERRMYLPLISVIAPVILVGARLCREVCDRLALRPSAHTVLAGALLVALAVPLGLATLRRNEVYQDPVAIWRDALAKRPNNALAHCGLGVALVKSGRSAEAFDHFAQAVRLKPADALLQYNLGKAYDARGDYEAAIERYNTAINLRPDYRQAHNALGNALVRMRRIDLARRHYEQALRIDPAYLNAHANLAALLVQQGHVREALAHYAEVVSLDPRDADAHYNRALALLTLDRVDDAVQELYKVLQLDPTRAAAYYHLGNAFVTLGELERAETAYRNALRLKPGDADAQRALDRMLRPRAPSKIP